jgi:hypothetical protein
MSMTVRRPPGSREESVGVPSERGGIEDTTTGMGYHWSGASKPGATCTVLFAYELVSARFCDSWRPLYVFLVLVTSRESTVLSHLKDFPGRHAG